MTHPIKKARKRLGLTQQQLGERVGVSRRAIHNIEQHWAVPKRVTRLRLVKALGVRFRPDDFFKPDSKTQAVIQSTEDAA